MQGSRGTYFWGFGVHKQVEGQNRQEKWSCVMNYTNRNRIWSIKSRPQSKKSTKEGGRGRGGMGGGAHKGIHNKRGKKREITKWI